MDGGGRVPHIDRDRCAAGRSALRITVAVVRCKKQPSKEAHMSGNTKRAKGRAKQAVGAVTGDDKLKQEGKRDERVGELENKVDDVTDAVNDKLDEVIEKVSREK